MDRFSINNKKNLEQEEAIESTYVREVGEWIISKEGGKWKPQLLPIVPLFTQEGQEERERRGKSLLEFMHETNEKWKESDSEHRNEGFLRDHPRYHELYVKWALRWLRNNGFDKRKFIDEIDEEEGQLLRMDGRRSGYWLTNETANGREWIDEFIAFELRYFEGFVDITHDRERKEKLGIEPGHRGWWAQSEI